MNELNRLFKREHMFYVRKGIQNKYIDKYLNRPYPDPDGRMYGGIFPDIIFNQTRDNYIPLKDSFDIELREKKDSKVGVPGTETLMKIFCRDDYIPMPDLLAGCLLYIGVDHLPIELFEFSLPVVDTSLPPSDLIINDPFSGKIVPREVIVTGRVSNARSVWTVIKGGPVYYVQWEGKVEEDGTWESPIIVGRDSLEDVGYKYLLRAFVNPIKPIRTGFELISWPESQLASEVVEITRGP